MKNSWQKLEKGDEISVLIPRIDSGGTDLPRVPNIIGWISNNSMKLSLGF